MRAVACRVKHAGVGVEDFAEAAAGAQGIAAGGEGVAAGPVHGRMLARDRAHHEGAHERRVVAAIGAGELDGELVPLGEPAAPGLVPAQQGVGAGAEDERVAGILAAAAEDRALHGREDVALEGARRAEALGLRQRVVGERGGTAHVGQLVVALHDTERGDEVGCVLQRAEVAERRLDLAPVGCREPLRVALDADALSGAAVLGHHVAESAGRDRRPPRPPRCGCPR